MAKHNLQNVQVRQKEQYDKKVIVFDFKLGDKIWLQGPVVLTGVSAMFHNPWCGPWRLVNLKNYPNVELEGVQNPDRKLRVHVN